MRFVNPIPFVRDVAASKAFYTSLLGLRVVEDHGHFVRFETGFAIHDGTRLEQTIWGTSSANPSYGRRNVLLYFEEENLDALFERIHRHVKLIHPIQTQDWGQRVFRFYDPDGHVIEIGEPQN